MADLSKNFVSAALLVMPARGGCGESAASAADELTSLRGVCYREVLAVVMNG